MDEPAQNEFTILLRAWSGGDRSALDKLMPIVFNELHKAAHRYMTREKPGHTLQTTGLVNEVYLRLLDASGISWRDRAHFFEIAARLMRRVLVDFARARARQKRGGHVQKVTFDDALEAGPRMSEDFVALDEALTALAHCDPRKARVVELRFFGGLSVEESAKVLKVSRITVLRDWKVAKLWLLREMSRD